MSENEFKHWAFLSYSQQDNCEQRPGDSEVRRLVWAERLREALKSFPIPAEFVGQPNSRGEIIPDRIDAVYQAAPTADAAGDLSEADRLALEQSRCLIVICSPRSAQSALVNETVRRFKQLGRGNRILPLVIAGEPNASEGPKPGFSPDAECFVPALRHPVAADGTLILAQREGGYFFADARFGADRKEVSTDTELLAETELAIAKIHLISGVLGVGFYGLWQREQKRRFVGFAEAQQQVREVQSQFEFARDQAQSAQAQLQALQAQARETLSQLEAARLEARAAQDRLLTNQNVPLDLQAQIRAAQDQALDAQNRSQAMQNQIEALQAQARASQEQLEAARQQVQSTEQKSLEAQQQARIAQAQVEQARHQARETQQQLDAAGQQLRAAQQQALAVQTPSAEVEPQAQELQNQLRAAQEETRAAQAQVEAALSRAQAAEATLATAQAQAHAAQQQVLELQSQVRAAQAQLDEARHERREAQHQITEAQQQAKAAQDEVLRIRNQTREVQARIDDAQKQVADAKNESRGVRDELSATQQKVRTSQRLTKVFAVLAVLAALAAGVIWSQHNASKSELAKRDASDAALSGVATNQLDSKQIRQALARTRGLDLFVNRIPAEKISETLNLAATILTEQQYGQFQDELLAVWTKTNAPAAFEWSRQLTNESHRAAVLAKTIPAMAADSATNALVAFEWLQNPTNAAALPPGKLREVALTGLFRNWAAQDLDLAASASGQLPSDATRQTVAAVILSQRIQRDPAAAASVVTHLPTGDQRKLRIAELGRSWAATDATNALAWAESLPVESDRSLAVRFVVERWLETDLAAATNWVAGLPEETKNTKLLQLAESWAQQDARGLADHAFALPDGDVQTQLLTEACRALATNDFSATATLLQRLTNNPALRYQLLEQAAGRTIASQLATTAEFIAGMPMDEDQAAAIKGLIPKWQSIAPETALNWLRAFPETNAQPAQVEFVLNSWAEREPAAVAQWLANQPSDSTTDAMFAAFLDGAVVRYPEFAAQWTQAVPDEAQRQKFQVQVAKAWLQRDAIAAPKWIETLELPAAIKQTLK